MSQFKASHRKWPFFRVDNWFFFPFFWGPRPPQLGRAAAAMLRRSQVCSALRFFRSAQKTRSGLTATAAQRWAMARFARRRLRRLFKA
ncbi:hypothetical protein SGRA_3969 [Saprospira grandis str. Lewin]|uniref:Uncharacterized protein n=1 Tax=Saprospira grandis (strain Lewin) TaxID=984262 RepID=H6L8F9_SAPGL|nr:hypothetical protein SGRA_3969 [Saprospira grandis str. Lewin]